MTTLDIYIKECFTYCPLTGFLVWRKDRPRYHFNSNSGYGVFKSRASGKVAGSIKKRPHTNYLEVKVLGKKMVTHRIAWYLMTGIWPEFIDHIDHNGENNKWVNLRAVTRQQNSQNTRLNSNNTSGHTGVMYEERRKMWRSEICVNGKGVFLGYFTSKDDAIAKRKIANANNLFHCNHGRII